MTMEKDKSRRTIYSLLKVCFIERLLTFHMTLEFDRQKEQFRKVIGTKNMLIARNLMNKTAVSTETVLTAVVIRILMGLVGCRQEKRAYSLQTEQKVSCKGKNTA